MHVMSMRSSDPAHFSRALKHFLVFEKIKPQEKEKRNPTPKQTKLLCCYLCYMPTVCCPRLKHSPSVHKIYSAVAFGMREENLSINDGAGPGLHEFTLVCTVNPAEVSTAFG